LDVAAICSYGGNKKEAALNALQSIALDKWPIYDGRDKPVDYDTSLVDPACLSGPENLYIFWALGKKKHIVCLAKNMLAAKRYLRGKDIAVYKGWLIKVIKLENDKCPDDNCIWRGSVCRGRLGLAEEPKFPNLDGTPNLIPCPICGEENLSSRTYCLDCGQPLHKEPKKEVWADSTLRIV